MTDIGCLGTKCYVFINKVNLTVAEAGVQCDKLNGSHLGSILDQETNNFIHSKAVQFGKVPFIGAVSQFFPWRWVSGEPSQGTYRYYYLDVTFW